MLQPALVAAEKLNASLVDMRFVKPLDQEMIAQMATNHNLVVTVEENVLAGGAGSAVNELLQQSIKTETLNLGVPDNFIRQDNPESMLAQCGLDEEGILTSIEDWLSHSAITAARIS